MIVAQGWEAGGHVRGTVATLPLVPAVVDAVAPVPVIAAGGIGDARGVAAVLALGAQAGPAGQRKLFGQIIVRHMCATGEPSKPSPSPGCRKFRPTTSSNSSKSTAAFGSNE